MVDRESATAGKLPHVARLQEGLRALGAAYARRRALLTVQLGLACLGVLTAWFVLVDTFLRFPQRLCWTHWWMAIGVIVCSVALAIQRVMRRPSVTAAARLAEQAGQCGDNRWTNAVQLAGDEDVRPEFVDALLAEPETRALTVTARDLVPFRRFGRVGAVLVACAVLVAAAWCVRPSGVTRSLLRLVAPMAELPPYTATRIVDVEPGDVAVPRGTPLCVVARTEGVAPDSARVEWREAEGVEGDRPMTPPEEGSSGWAAELAEVVTPMRYRICAGDAVSEWYRVEVRSPPALLEWRLEAVPPEYTGLAPVAAAHEDKPPMVPVRSRATLSGVADCGLRNVTLTQGTEVRGTWAGNDKAGEFSVDFEVGPSSRMILTLAGHNGLSSTTEIPFSVIFDLPPSVRLFETPYEQSAAPTAEIPVGFVATDRYGVSRTGIEMMVDDGDNQEVGEARPPAVQTPFTGRFLVDLATLGARPGKTLNFRLWAEDNGPEPGTRRAYSRPLRIRIPRTADRHAEAERKTASAKDALAEIIRTQRENLSRTRGILARRSAAGELALPDLQLARGTQAEIRTRSVALVQDPPPLGDLLTVLNGLIAHEMPQAVAALDQVRKAGESEQTGALQAAIKLETRILATLTGLDAGIANETRYQRRADLLAALQRLVEGQRDNLKETLVLLRTPQGEAKPNTEPLVAREDALAHDLLAFLADAAAATETGDDFAVPVRQGYDLIRKRNTYDTMLDAAELLEVIELETAARQEREALRALAEALAILNEWRVKHATEVLAKASEAIQRVADELAEMQQKQAKILEVTREITKRGMDDDEVREKLRAMDEEQKEMQDLVEKLAQDLYQFPELPVCNELNSKMREIYESVEQALGSEDAPTAEIAVQKEDSFLDALRDTTERAEDLEMWLPDTPDNTAWNMESFDTDEFPEIPLVPLPDELEDLVGDLLEQTEQMAAEAQDATGNNLAADMVMGWDVVDGPIPNFSAKGKSGNTRPNDNEMTGRSGAGREGQSNGELVEDVVKGLEGTETHARRTRDPLQKGTVEEADDSTMDARATGGGKLGGESETIGMFGDSPRRDVDTPAHGTKPTDLRRETEALYAKARLLYLNTGKLGGAARDLRALEETSPEMGSFDTLTRRVMRQMSDAQVEIGSGAVLPMSSTTVLRSGGAVIQDVDLDTISSEYRGLISDYYRSLERTE